MAKRLIAMARDHWGLLILSALGLLGATLSSLVTPGLIRSLTAALDSPAGVDFSGLVSYMAVLVGAYVLRMGCRFVNTYFAHVAAWRFVPDVTVKVYDKLQRLSMSYYQNKQTGQLLSRTVNDVTRIELLIAHALPDLISNALMVIAVTGILLSINPTLALLTFVPVPFVAMASTVFTKKVAPLFRTNQRVLGELSGMVQDNLSGMKEIQAFGQEEREHQKIWEFRKVYSDVNIRANFWNGIFHPSVEFITSLGTVVVVGFGGYLATKGAMSTADIIGFLLYLSLFYQPIASLARLTEDVQNAFAGAARAFEVLDAKSDIEDSPGAYPLPRPEGRVAFESVTFYYSEDEPVLKNVSFTAEPGQMIALVGPTGVGKTTIVSLMERFYDPIRGRVTIDGHDVRGVTVASLRAQMSIVLQDVFLFNGTVAENIAYGVKEATLGDVEAAARIANADGFIRQMPQGYDTLVGERGVRLSGGQKQRISIARAVLRDAPILILDEATASVDVETEAEIQQAIAQLAGSRTIVVIAHRLSTIMRADQILVLENGEIVERGKHEELIEAGGAYARLCQVQWRAGKREADAV